MIELPVTATFQTPIAATPEPLPLPPWLCVSIAKLQVPAGNPVLPAASTTKPLPLGVVDGDPTGAAEFVTFGWKTK